jgi:hypothetical protein
MSVSSPIEFPSKQKPFSQQTLTASKNQKALSPQILQALMEKVQLGDRNQARVFISQALNVNDVVAECCLRHLEEKLAGEQDYRERILRQATSLGAANITDHQQFLRDAFGVQGIVSKAILNHWRIAGA